MGIQGANPHTISSLIFIQVTVALGGESYLNFMGNEFGHPEWIDFPREVRGWTRFTVLREFRGAGETQVGRGADSCKLPSLPPSLPPLRGTAG